MLEIDCCGEMLHLHHNKALWWRKRSSVFVADTHFGKDAIFRARGLALPSGSNKETLRCLSDVLRETTAERLVILGDFLHGKLPEGDDFWLQFQQWRKKHAQLHLELIVGNHDRHVLRSEKQSIKWLSYIDEPPFHFCHEPAEHPEFYSIAGHVHPCYRMRLGRSDAMRLPAFVFGKHSAILPAFGRFTGGFNITPHKTDRIFVAGEDAVMPIKQNI